MSSKIALLYTILYCTVLYYLIPHITVQYLPAVGGSCFLASRSIFCAIMGCKFTVHLSAVGFLNDTLDTGASSHNAYSYS